MLVALVTNIRYGWLKRNQPECVTEQPSVGALTGQGSFASYSRNHRKNFEHSTKPEKKTCSQFDALLWHT